ncbi:glucosamine-6-phosphate deaminase [Escherichia coli]|nr:glucosamine-6-phosphate deaminase [Escherichia coli]
MPMRVWGRADAPRDKRTYFREINYIAAAFQYQKKNYKSA